MGAPLAYFLTWHTYGTWLHGDARGSVDWRHNGFMTPMIDPSPVRLEQARGRMNHAAVALSTAARALVERTLVTHCASRRWDLHAAAVRSNHAHVVVGFAGLPPEPMLAQFKAYATRALRLAGLAAPATPVWVEEGSTRYLWTPAAVNATVAYVREGQDVPR